MSALTEKLAELRQLDSSGLKAEWRRLFRSQPPSLSRDLTQRAIAHRYQEVALGGLSKATARKLRAVDDGAKNIYPVSPKVPRPAILPGARLIREWHGRTHSVTVTESGFEYDGRLYRSLTEIAKAITGTHWSGPRFFGLQAKSKRQAGTSDGVRYSDDRFVSQEPQIALMESVDG
jgi:hypothetical protein